MSYPPRSILRAICPVLLLSGLFLFTGCASGDGSTDAGGDSGGTDDGGNGDDDGASPGFLTVISVSPAQGSTLVDPATAIVITFSDSVNPQTVTSNAIVLSLNGAPIAGSLAVDGAQVTLTPDAPLTGLWEHEGLVTADVAGLSGSALEEDFTWSFTPATAPMVAGGGWHVLALQADGTVWSWGFDSEGQLGIATMDYANVESPVQVCAAGGTQPCQEFLTDVIAVAAGDEHSLALKKDGTVWAWGDGADGQLGQGMYNGSTTPVQVIDPTDPSGFLTDVVAIAANYYSSAALKSGGSVWTWGDNYDSKLGHDAVDWHTPGQVLGPGGSGFLTDVVAIAMGAFDVHALRSDDTLWGWGDNAYGEIGNGVAAEQTYPVQAVAPAELPTLFGQARSMAAGAYQLLIVAEDGTLWGVGDNVSGELGLGSTTDTTSFKPVCASNGTLPCSVADQDILTDVTSVATGGDFTVAGLEGGSVVSFGYNGAAALGDGTTTTRTKPVLVCTAYSTQCDSVLEGADGVVVTQYWAGFALFADGTIQSWGTDWKEELARPSTQTCASGRPCSKVAALVPDFSLAP